MKPALKPTDERELTPVVATASPALEWFEGKLMEVKDPGRSGWWRFHQHYDRDGYCDNPGRGY